MSQVNRVSQSGLLFITSLPVSITHFRSRTTHVQWDQHVRCMSGRTWDSPTHKLNRQSRNKREKTLALPPHWLAAHQKRIVLPVPPTAIQTGAQWLSTSSLLRCWHWREMPHFLYPFSHTRWKMWLAASYAAAVFCGCWQSVPGKTFGVNLGPNFLLHCKLFSQTLSSSVNLKLRIKHKGIAPLCMRCLVSIIWSDLPSS